MTPRERELQARVEELEEELRQTRRALMGDGPHPLRFTPTERQVFSILVNREVATHAAIDCVFDGEVDQPANRKVTIHNIRKKLEGTGIHVGTLLGTGYYIAPATRRLIKSGVIRL